MPPRAPAFKASTLAEWKKRSRMEVTLPSGSTVVLRTLSLDELAANDGLPNDLLHVAYLEQVAPGGSALTIAQKFEAGDSKSKADAKRLADARRDLVNMLVLAAVVSPKLTAKDVSDLDPADREMIADLTQRRTNVDAAGKQVGADMLDSFRSAAAILARAESDPARKAVLLGLSETQ